MNVFGEEPIWIHLQKNIVIYPKEDHLQELFNQPDLFGIEYFDEDNLDQPFNIAYQNGWVRIKSSPKYKEAGIETNDLRKARKTINWILDHKPEMCEVTFS